MERAKPGTAQRLAAPQLAADAVCSSASGDNMSLNPHHSSSRFCDMATGVLPTLHLITAPEAQNEDAAGRQRRCSWTLGPQASANARPSRCGNDPEGWEQWDTLELGDSVSSRAQESFR